MSELVEILHNIAEHTETLHKIIGDAAISSELKQRLVDHIILEEKENSARLTRLHAAQPAPIIQKLIDHSYFLQKMVNEDAMITDLKIELLHHFMEEHLVWQKDLELNFHAGTTAIDSSSKAPAKVENETPSTPWTVGPMWGQGG
ncbi:MAG: hypothetical protein K8F91_19535 [Candidatus Obscuribacterales bacterium]|nr:hypothetical protein [Candidatus Obscuribacterales bacterium]